MALKSIFLKHRYYFVLILAALTGFNFSSAQTTDVTRPTVTSVSPANNAWVFDAGTVISVVFSEAMNPATITSTTIELRRSDLLSTTLIPATVVYNAATRTAKLYPVSTLGLSSYIAKVKGGTSGVKDIAGNAMLSDYTWSFRNLSLFDDVRPVVLSTSPATGATGVSTASTVSVVFSETMRAASISTSTFQLRNAANVLIPATVTYNTSTRTATLRPTNALANSTVYTATVKGVSSGAEDVAGNDLASNYVWSFTTAAPVDNTAPVIYYAVPSNGTTGVALNSTAYVGFSEAMNVATINTTTVQLRNSSNVLVPGTVTYDANAKTAIITPSALLTNATVYTATITGGAAGVKDVAGNTLASNYSWSFTAVQDFISPTVTSVSPVTGTNNVSVTTAISAVFSEPMNAATITAAAFTLRNTVNNTTLPVAVNYNTATRTATLTYTGSLAYSITYAVTVKSGSTGVKDAAGNSLTNDYTWAFITVAPPADVIPPTVTSVSPVNGSTGVAITATVSANFSEVLNGNSVSGSAFQLRNAAGTLIAAAVTYNGSTNTATLAPSVSLSNSTTYTATISGGTAGVKDLAGNAMVNSYSWTFTTVAAPVSTVTIFQPTDIPVTPLAIDQTIEVGTRFRTTQNGLVTGFRFYKGAGNTGTNTGHLWSSAGMMLAEATFVNESASGWQQVLLSTPVAITTGNTYVVSYFNSAGNYAFTNNYFTTAVVNGPLRAPADGEEGGNGVYIYTASPAFPVSTYLSTNYWADILFAATTGPDVTSPSVVSVTPVNAAANINVNTVVTAMLSESMNASTISGSTVELRNTSNGAVVAATVSYNSVANAVTLTPSSPLTASTIYTATVKGGAAGVKDLAGNAMANDYTWTFTTIAPVAATNTIFQPTDIPVTPLAIDQTIEVGTRFRTTQNGLVTGFRFYKGAGNTGTNTGHLWSSAGVMLAEATFVNESASGWQQVLLSAPVAITTGATYIVSYFNSAGNYAFTNNYFTTSVVNGPLRALADGEEGGNGVYIYTASPAFPVSTYLSTNYWADILFAASIGPDTTPPSVVSVTPVNAAANVNVNTVVTAVFSEALNASSVNSSTVELRTASNTLISASITYNAAGNTATLTPSSALAASSVYTVTVKGGASGIKDLAGNAMSTNYTWTFTTTSEPLLAPTEGPGGPILVISSVANPFSRYAVEILRAEGLNEFAASDISAVTASVLNNYDVVVLGEMTVTEAQVTLLTNWVNAGGTLIAFKPASSLNSLMGISAATGTLTDKYLLVNTTSGPGVGIVNQTIQFHGTANLHTLSGAASLATLYADATTATINPAVTMRTVGANGGRAIAFTYDLAKSIIYTRQGNPAWAGQKRDGEINPIRSDDLFFGGTSSPDWIDFNKIAIPQADEQQRLLANIILQSNLHRKPLPRFWYLPRDLKAAVVMTGDDHAVNGTVDRFNHFLTLGPNTSQDVANWNAVRGTSYVYPNTPITDAQATSFQAQGFELALHPTTGCVNYTPASLESDFTSQLAQFGTAYPGVSAPATNRTHCLAWSDWATTPKVEAQKGIRLDVTYYYWPEVWMQNRPGMFTGSGMPMRFADLDGSLIDVYQATTQMTDETNMNYTAFCNAVLDKAVGAEGYYGVFTANMHTDRTSSTAASDAIVASAQARQVPVISAKQMLTWLDARNNSSFGDMVWNNDQLTFSVTVRISATGIKAMLPFFAESGQLISITRNGSPVSFTVQTIKGMQYGFFAPATGTNTYVATYNTPARVMAPPAVPAIVPQVEQAAPVAKTMEKATEEKQTQPGQLYVNIMPNPSTGYFNMVINSNDENPVTVKVMDISGRVIERHEKITSSGILRIGQSWSAGSYFAEVVQGGQRKVVKLIKAN